MKRVEGEPGCGHLTFEEAVAELEAIVAALESGSLSLDVSMERFERAILLSRHCADRLDAADRRIRVLESETYARDAVEIPLEAAGEPEAPPPPPEPPPAAGEFDPFAD
jgi:exodeoxyribonuclease VII small subunit